MESVNQLLLLGERQLLSIQDADIIAPECCSNLAVDIVRGRLAVAVGGVVARVKVSRRKLAAAAASLLKILALGEREALNKFGG